MADINLEAETVVGEEAERPPKGRRFLQSRGTIVVIGIVLVLEAAMLFVFFGHSRMNSASAASKGGQPSDSASSPAQVKEYLEDGGRAIDVGDVTIWDLDDTSPRADRRFTGSFKVYVSKSVYAAIEAAADKNPDALGLIKDDLKDKIAECMLNTGGDRLSDKEMQKKFPQILKDYLSEKIDVLKGNITQVFMTKFSRGKY